ncbi:splicing factor u2af-associated protein 2 [Multifurca ochricompacta]|uniref:Splicing factor u2af-associated protein 2 n=1 Tax=Multifurca ochricompacta TaxID=376703 RepID=A0AAD4M8C6_9AGAM|nr:splicing factor u2af-associated protein 2 [Multifurca ochricompacta]
MSATTLASFPRATPGAPAEEQAIAFEDDPRVHFDTQGGRWRLEDGDAEFEYEPSKAVWIPVVDEDLIRKQQAAYSVAGVDEETPAAPVLARTNKKRKEPEDYTSSTVGQPGPSTKRGKGAKGANNGNAPPVERKSKNTAVFVRLPFDATFEEVVERFSKCGLIEEDNEGDPKVKMYAREDGTFSGEALVVYFKEDSVSLAINILDDAELRLGDPLSRMSVQRAEFGPKNDDAGGAEKPRRVVDRKKTTKRIGRMQKKLEEWVDEDNFGPAITEENTDISDDKNSRVVVLKYMFTLKELEEDPSLLLDLKEDVREECETLGEVTNVVLYDKEPDGIMTVKFRDPVSAQACVLKMKGRFFAGRKVEAFLWMGKQYFKRSGVADDVEEAEGDEGEKKRLDAFAQWLFTEGD